jgi:uncharacterized membrane protein YoaK (UPF0700 family)
MSGTVDADRTRTLWFAMLLILTNGFLDAHTYLVRGGVFANVQTGNMVFFAIDLAERKWSAASAHVWPFLAFMAGIVLASHIKSGRVDRVLSRPLRWTMAVQAIALVVIGFIPASVPHSLVTVPICFLAAVQIGLFRNIGDLSYMPVATTGNVYRFVESGYDGYVERNPVARHAFNVYGALLISFASGAVIGALASWLWQVHAIWLAAALLAVTLIGFISRRPR